MRAVLLIAPVAAVLIGGASWLRLRLLVVTVQGQSMAPTYAHGDRVLVRRARPGRLRAGQVVVVDLPVDMRPAPAGVGRAEAVRQRRVIKRVAAVSGEAVPAAVPAATATVPAGRMALLGGRD